MTLGNFLENNIKINIAILLYKFGLLPKIYNNRIKAIIYSKFFFKKFKKLKLISNNDGSFKVNPMPSISELNDFYKNANWQKSNEKNYPIKIRDIQHYKLITDIFPDFNKSKKNILNFGAGHAGISILFKIAGHNIYNLDPSTTVKYFENNWHNIKQFDEIDTKIDLIYGSHSLEHVTDIYFIINEFKKISNDKTIHFFEVPNHPFNKIHKIDPPHTYYFSRLFFENHFQNIIHNKTYSKSGELKSKDEGEVIRFISNY